MDEADTPEALDSRTMTVGRKRGFEESMDSENLTFDRTVDGESIDCSRKRAKGQNEALRASSPVGNLIETSPLGAVSPPAMEPTSAQIAVPTTGWNQGVQGLLRTSFGARSHAMLNLQSKQQSSNRTGQSNSDVSSTLSAPSPTFNTDPERSVDVPTAGPACDISRPSLSHFTAGSPTIDTLGIGTQQSILPSVPPKTPDIETQCNMGATMVSKKTLVLQNETSYSQHSQHSQHDVFDATARTNYDSAGSGSSKSHQAMNEVVPQVNPNPEFHNPTPGKQISKKELKSYNKLSNQTRALLPPETISAYENARSERIRKRKAKVAAKVTMRKADDKVPKLPKLQKHPKSPQSRGSNLYGDECLAGLSSRLPFQTLAPPKQKGRKARTKGVSQISGIDKTIAALEKKIPGMINVTSQVDTAIVEHGWPLPATPEMMVVKQKISSGSTFFARLVPKPPIYQIGKETFLLPQVLHDKRPVKIQNFSFNLFLVAFLSANETRWNILTDSKVKSAFNSYRTIYYSHIHLLAGWLEWSGAPRGIMSVDEAKKRIHKIRGGESPADILSTAAMPTDPTPGSGNSTIEELRTVTHAITKNEDSKDCKDLKDSEVESNDILDGTDSSEDESVDVDDSDLATPESLIILGRPASSHSLTTDASISADFECGQNIDSEDHLQQKYFPLVKGSAVALRCLACSSTDHRTWNCSALTCSLCGSNAGHSSSNCPLRQRCGKCREIGHAAVLCPEKLSRTSAEAVPCDLCSDTSHVESDCHILWRSFRHDFQKRREVYHIAIYCYSCGAGGHFGPECGIHSGPLLSGAFTWATNMLGENFKITNRNQTLGTGNIGSVDQAQSHLSIKGKATGRAHGPIVVDNLPPSKRTRQSLKNKDATQSRSHGIVKGSVHTDEIRRNRPVQTRLTSTSNDWDTSRQNSNFTNPPPPSFLPINQHSQPNSSYPFDQCLRPQNNQQQFRQRMDVLNGLQMKPAGPGPGPNTHRHHGQRSTHPSFKKEKIRGKRRK